MNECLRISLRSVDDILIKVDLTFSRCLFQKSSKLVRNFHLKSKNYKIVPLRFHMLILFEFYLLLALNLLEQKKNTEKKPKQKTQRKLLKSSLNFRNLFKTPLSKRQKNKTTKVLLTFQIDNDLVTGTYIIAV